MEPPSTLELLQTILRQPEYLHVLLHPLPIYGLGLGAMALVIAMALRSRPAQVTALSILFVSAVSTFPVMELGENGYDAIEAKADNDGADWLDVHAQRATRAKPAYLGFTLLALAALVLPWKFPKSALPLNLTTLLASLALAALGAWIGHAGGQVRHKEFRHGPPPEEAGGYEQMRD